MPQPKTTAEIRAAPDAFKAARARAIEAFRSIEGVVSVGFGLKQTAGRFGDELAIVVFVREKKPAEELAPAHRIPPLFEDYRTDVRVVPQMRLGVCNNTTKYATIQGGIQIVNKGGTTIHHNGTLGCIVRRRNDAGRENVYLLSNAHVMHADGRGARDNMFHPTRDDETLGPIQDGGAFRNIIWPPGTPPPNPLPFPGNPDDPANHINEAFIDCAIARLNLDSCCGCTKDTTDYAESIIDLVNETPPGAGRGDAVHASNRIADVRDVFNDPNFMGEIVTKVGRTTGRTQGKCVGVTSTAHIADLLNPAGPKVFAYNCLEIIPDPPGTLNCRGHAYFAEEGDSGSLVLDAQRRAVGLLFSVPDPDAVPPPPPDSSSGACFIVPVLDHLGICIPCAAGASGHGSSLAADGSGVAPAPLAPAQSTLTSQIAFLAGGAVPAPAPQPPLAFTPPVPVNEAQGQRMHALLAEFRGTRLGRPLSAVIDDVRRELGYLVRNVRPVKVVWGRHQGPAWLACLLNHIAGHAPTIPNEIKGITRRALLVKMREVLEIHGSNPLRHALTEHGEMVLEMLTDPGCDSLADLVAWIRKREREDDRAGATRQPATEGVT